jgi:plasmid maintenance system antidote protein VapI/Zn-dependent peptidase ImmA (M78 family)
MADSTPFTPGWASPPGATIATILRERGLGHQEFAHRLRTTVADIDDLLRGAASITSNLAGQLATVLGASAAFWTRREEQYRADLARLEREASLPDSLDWLDEIPVKDMVRLGWLEPGADEAATAFSCLRFFGVPSVGAWWRTYQNALQAVALRTSATFQSAPGAVAAWLRRGEIEAASIKCGPWVSERFRHELGAVRALTREPDPKVFIPKLQGICAACGVAVVPLRAPKACKASGAALFLSPARPLLMLSFRYLSDDHLWYTFFHEAGHLVLHGNRCVFVDGEGAVSDAEEEEANRFAAEILIPPAYHEELLSLTANKRAVVRFAKRLGVARGIVVGQMQHRGIIERNQLNDLKHWYEWGDD